jgi:hypothetical protein
LTSRHLALKAAREELTARLFADPLYCDPLLGAWWLWGIASWIGDGWGVADGPWINVDGRLVDRRVEESAERRAQSGETLKRSNAQTLPIASVPRKMPDVGGTRSTERAPTRGVQAYRHHAGVPRQMPEVGAGKLWRKDGRGVQQSSLAEPTALAAYFARLSDRLRRVRFLCGDWRRACKDSVTVNHGLTAVFLDPPYPQAEHDMAYHEAEAGDVWYQAAAWAVERGTDKRLRICIAGYWSETTDALFPATWERQRWEARGGYANQKADGRGRANAKRECLWYSPHCIDAKTDYGPLFADLEDA